MFYFCSNKAMDNRINEIRRKISALRAQMTVVEDAIRDQVNHDHDCTEAACRLLAMRSEMTTLIGQWKAAAGGARLPFDREHTRRRPADRPSGRSELKPARSSPNAGNG
jgi:hypothetical protein